MKAVTYIKKYFDLVNEIVFRCLNKNELINYYSEEIKITYLLSEGCRYKYKFN